MPLDVTYEVKTNPETSQFYLIVLV